MSVLGWSVWYSLWLTFSGFVGLGSAAMGLGPVMGFFIVLVFCGLFFVSTVSLHSLVN